MALNACQSRSVIYDTSAAEARASCEASNAPDFVFCYNTALEQFAHNYDRCGENFCGDRPQLAYKLIQYGTTKDPNDLAEYALANDPSLRRSLERKFARQQRTASSSFGFTELLEDIGEVTIVLLEAAAIGVLAMALMEQPYVATVPISSSSAQLGSGTGVLRTSYLGGANRICVYNRVGAVEYHTVTAGRVCPASISGPLTTVRPRGAILNRQSILGPNKICIYSAAGSEYAITVRAGSLCP